jgi:hypothetical protein
MSDDPVVRMGTDGRLMFWCQGCGMAHQIQHGVGNGPRWTWNGSLHKPTFQPSVLVQWDTLSPAARQRNREFYAANGRYMTNAELPYDEHHVCHTFVTDGRVQYLGDCTHALAGQTVDLQPFDEGN